MVEMTVSKLLIASVCLIFAVGLQVQVIGARPAPDQVAAMAEALKVLQQLDRHYAQIAKPRLRRRYDDDADAFAHGITTTTNNGGIRSVANQQDAARLLHLLQLDRLYSLKTKPRFGRSLNVHSYHDSTENDPSTYSDTAEEYRR